MSKYLIGEHVKHAERYPMKTKTKRSFFRSQSPKRQELLLCMHEKQNGTIRDLPVVAGEPRMSEARVRRTTRLDKWVVPKPASKNFCLKQAHLRLMQTLDEMGDGVISRIVFQDGLPVEVE